MRVEVFGGMDRLYLLKNQKKSDNFKRPRGERGATADTKTFNFDIKRANLLLTDKKDKKTVNLKNIPNWVNHLRIATYFFT